MLMKHIFVDLFDGETDERGRCSLQVAGQSRDEQVIILHSEPCRSLTYFKELGLPRTTNAVESWHNRWNTLVGRAHVGFWQLVNMMRKEEHEMGGEIKKTLRSESARAETSRDGRLRAIIAEKAEFPSLIRFIEAIAAQL